jgi:hypothetical protein
MTPFKSSSDAFQLHPDIRSTPTFAGRLHASLWDPVGYEAMLNSNSKTTATGATDGGGGGGGARGDDARGDDARDASSSSAASSSDRDLGDRDDDGDDAVDWASRLDALDWAAARRHVCPPPIGISTTNFERPSGRGPLGVLHVAAAVGRVFPKHLAAKIAVYAINALEEIATAARGDGDANSKTIATDAEPPAERPYRLLFDAQCVWDAALTLAMCGGKGAKACYPEVRSMSHWSPYDRVRVVNADP